MGSQHFILSFEFIPRRVAIMKCLIVVAALVAVSSAATYG